MLTVSDRDSCCVWADRCVLTVSSIELTGLYVDSVGQRQLLCLGRSLCVDSVEY